MRQTASIDVPADRIRIRTARHIARLPHLLAASVLAGGLLMTPAVVPAHAAKPAAAPAAKQGVDPDSVQALERMSSYLRTLRTFELKADILQDEIGDDGRKLQIGSSATYRVRRPNGFTIEQVSDRKVRRLFYDGKTVTLLAPKVGYYAQAPAPATIQQTLDLLHDKYDIEVPLEDLFRWGEPGDSRDRLVTGYYVGPARINGVETDQYAYSTGDLDWQVWIDRGDKPAPRKIVITDTSDEAQPQFAATLAWNAKPTFGDADFTFTPPAGSGKITFGSTVAQAGK